VIASSISEEIRMELLNMEETIEYIQFKCNISATEPDELTFPVLKIEKKVAASTMIGLTKFILSWKKFPDYWKKLIIILFHIGMTRERQRTGAQYL
jgi:hypothetical protein